MTTVACRDGVMASDGQVTNGGIIVTSDTPKIFQHDGCLLGVCGLYGEMLALKKWFEGGMTGENPKLEEDSEALILNPDGSLFGLWEKQFMVPINDEPFSAIGSGRVIALGAMAMGATAIESVEVAIRYDIYSGGEVFSFASEGPV